MFFIQNIQILLEINVIYHLKNLQMVEFFCATQKKYFKKYAELPLFKFNAQKLI